MLLRPDAEDLRVIGFYLGRIFALCGVAGLVPLAWAVVGREWAPASGFVLMIAVFVFPAVWGPRRRSEVGRLDWSHGMVVAALSWLLVPAVGSIPLALSGHFGGLLDAYFEAMSGLTTTGLSVLQDLDHLAPSLNFWRHLLHFLGGQGIIVAALSLFAGSAGITLYYGEARDEKILPSVRSTARFIWGVSLVHLVFGVAALSAVGWYTLGFNPLRALFHGLLVFMAGFDTGGFTPQSTSLAYYHSALFEAVAAVLMVAGAMSFGVHFALWRGTRRGVLRNLESRTIVGTFAVALVATFMGLAALRIYTSVFGLARQGLFQVVSAHTGTGFSTVPGTELASWQGLAFAGIALAMALGGMAMSTSGGVKALRVGLALKVLKDQIKQVLLPERAVISQVYEQGGRKRLTAGVAQAVLVVSLLYVALYVAGAAVGLAYGYPLHDALFESISAGANVGLSVGVTNASMPVLLEITYIIQMWLGRLEFVAVFALLGFIVAGVRGR